MCDVFDIWDNNINQVLLSLFACVKYYHPECKKACGLYGVSAEHLMHCSSRVTPLLAMCITGLMVHVFFTCIGDVQ